MNKTGISIFESILDDIRHSNLAKEERILTTPQGAEITVQGDRKVLNFCANNYLG